MTKGQLIKQLEDELTCNWIILGHQLNISDFTYLFKWITSPGRLIPIAKRLSILKNYSAADELLSHLIERDEFFYPAGHYYRVFVQINQSNLKEHSDLRMLMKELRAAEKILDEHITLQRGYSTLVSHISSQAKSNFYVNDAYQRQKENNALLLEQLISSIRNLVGDSCNIQGLVETGITVETAEDVFQQLINEQFVLGCRVLEFEKSALQQVCHDYDIPLKSLENFIDETKGSTHLTEDKMEQLLVSHQLFEKRTRQDFWDFLEMEKVLYDVEKCVIFNKDDCPIDEGKARKIDVGLMSTTDERIIFFDPNHGNDYLTLEDAVVILESDAKDHYGSGYNRKKKQLNRNQIAKLDVKRLKEVNLYSLIGKMKQDCLANILIPEKDRPAIWQALVAQNIIDSKGNFKTYSPSFSGLSYPQCPVYEKSVNELLYQKLVCEKVRHHLLKGKLEAINELPTNCEASLLADLLDANIIAAPSAHRYNQDEETRLKRHFLSYLIPYADLVVLSDEKKELMISRVNNYLIGQRSALQVMETPIASLKSLSESITKASGIDGSIATEIHLLELNGFDETIELSEQKWSTKMMWRAVIIIGIGLAEIAIGFIILSCSPNIAMGFMNEGASDLIFGVWALCTGNHFTWADYRRHKMISLMTTAAIMAMGAICSKAIQFYQNGWKLTAPAAKGLTMAATEGVTLATTNALELSAKEVAKQQTKSALVSVVTNFGFGIVNHGIEAFINSQLICVCNSWARQLSSQLRDEVNKISFNETLAKLYKMKGHKLANRLIREATEKVLYGIDRSKSVMDQLAKTFSAGLSSACGSHSIVVFQSGTTALSATKFLSWITEILAIAKIIQNIVSTTTSYLSNMKTQLENDCLKKEELNDHLTTQVDNSEDKLSEFQEKAIEDIKNGLDGKVTELFCQLTSTLTQLAVRIVAKRAGRYIKKKYAAYQENKGFKNYSQIKIEEEQRQNSQAIDGSLNEPKDPSEEFVRSSLKLLEKNPNQKLYAMMVQDGIPLDAITGEAIRLGLPNHMQSKGVNVSEMGLVITTENGINCHMIPSKDQENMIILSLNRAQGSSFGHYESSVGENGSGGYDCGYEEIVRQLEEKFPGKGWNVADLRKVAADTIATDRDIGEAVRNGRLSTIIKDGLYGGKVCDHNDSKDCVGIGAPYGEASKHSKRGEVEADKQPAKHHLKNFTPADSQLRNIPIEDIPALTISKEDHNKTHNFGFKAHRETVYREPNMYLIKQREFLSAGNYKAAIEHASVSNHINLIVKPLKKQYREATDDATRNELGSLINRYKVGIADYYTAWNKLGLKYGTTFITDIETRSLIKKMNKKI